VFAHDRDSVEREAGVGKPLHGGLRGVAVGKDADYGPVFGSHRSAVDGRCRAADCVRNRFWGLSVLMESVMTGRILGGRRQPREQIDAVAVGVMNDGVPHAPECVPGLLVPVIACPDEVCVDPVDLRRVVASER
jgi:hypothetical protein